MTGEEKRMDELLRNRLEQFSAQPPERVWQGIRASVAQGKTPVRRLYLRWLAAAAVLLLAVVTGILVEYNQNQLSPVITEQLPPASQRNISTPDADRNIEAVELTAAEMPVVEQKATTLRKQIAAKNELVQVVDETRRSEWQMTTLRSIAAELKSPSSVLSLSEKTSVNLRADNLNDIDRRIIAANIDLHKHDQPEAETGWKVGLHLSPGYSSHTVTHSARYASNMTYADSDARAGVGAGFSVQYKTGSRWRIESGMYYSQTGGNSGNSFRFNSMRAEYADAPLSADKYFNTGVTMEMGQLAMNSTAGVIRFSRTPSNAELISMPEASFGLSTAMLTPGEFQQVFGFVELPLFARYRIVDSKIGIEWVGGLSTNILATNEVFMESSSGREKVGTTQDISTVNFSAATGVGVIYALGRNLSLSVEPRFSYYLNSINHSGDVNFKPWRVGVFTGLSYEF